MKVFRTPIAVLLGVMLMFCGLLLFAAGCDDNDILFTPPTGEDPGAPDGAPDGNPSDHNDEDSESSDDEDFEPLDNEAP